MGYWKRKAWPAGQYSGSEYIEPRDNKMQVYYPWTTMESSSVLRVPSLKRKSAWKRFYKMFPGLKGKSVIHGHSWSNGRELPASCIKLKKI